MLKERTTVERATAPWKMATPTQVIKSISVGKSATEQQREAWRRTLAHVPDGVDLDWRKGAKS